MISWAVVQVWGNLADLIQDHFHYVLCYLVVVALISFAVCYYKGPVSDTRSLNLIKWTLQAVAVMTVFLSMQVRLAEYFF